MNSDENKLCNKIVAFDETYNFVAEKFLNWNCLVPKYYCNCTDFKIWNLNYQTISDVDIVYTKVVVLTKSTTL
jgi:hypothetical protein